MSDIRAWLEGLGLAQYAEAFEANEIDLDLVRDLDDAALKDLGVGVMGHRVRLSRAIAAIGEDEGASTQFAPPETDAARRAGEAERRQITVMFCDLVGSTALSEQLDPEDLRSLMQAYQQAAGAVIERYDGHVAQYLGDGLMIYFGWPRAHEDDAERAVRAGLDIIQAVKAVEMPRPLAASEPLAVRIGIATGAVVVGETGAGDASVPKLAVGETPNLAARVQGLADPNCVTMTEATHRLVSGIFEFEDLGARELKGIAGAVGVFRALGERAVENRFEASHAAGMTPLVGRASELSLVMERWRQAVGGEGQVVLLSGEPGIGKSRVVQVLRESLADEPHFLLTSQCSPYHTSTAFYPVAEQMARMSGFARDDSADTKLDKLERHFAEMELDLARAVPLFAAALSIPTGDRYPPLDISPQEQKQQTVAALTERVVAASRNNPVLFVVEDLHWADPTSVETLGVIIEAVRDARVLVIGTYRPEFEPPWHGHGHVTALALNRMGRNQAADMVAKVTGGKSLPDEVLDQIVAKTDGVPLFVEELTKTVLEAGLLKATDGAYVLDGPLPPLAIPSTLRDSLMARLDRMAPVKEVAQIGACIGREFSHKLLGSVSSRDDAALRDALGQLVDSELIFRRGAPPDAIYTFKHALVRDAAYESLLKSERQPLHKAIAASLEADGDGIADSQPDLLALHYSEAGLNERALPFWRAAGRQAADRFAHAEAASHLTKALGALAAMPENAEREAQEIDLRLDLVASLRLLDRYDEALAQLDKAQALAETGARHGPLARIHGLRGNIYFPLGNLDGCLDEHQTAYAVARDAGLPEAEARALGGIGDAHYMRGQFKTAHDHFDRCMTLCREHGFLSIEIDYLPMRATTHMFALRFDEALADCAAVYELVAKHGQPRAEIVARTISGAIYCERRDFARTEQDTARALDVVTRVGARRLTPMFLCHLAKTKYDQGDQAAAQDVSQRGLTISRETGLKFVGAMVLGAIALTSADGNRRDEALREGEAILEQGCVGHNYFWFYHDAIERCLRDGAFAQADAYADALEIYLGDEGSAWSELVIAQARLLAKVGRDAHDDATWAALRDLRDRGAALGLVATIRPAETALATNPPPPA